MTLLQSNFIKTISFEDRLKLMIENNLIDLELELECILQELRYELFILSQDIKHNI